MGMPTVINPSSANADEGDCSPSLPTGWQEDDIFLLFLDVNSGAADPAVPNGWTQIGTTQSYGPVKTMLMWRRATGSESGPVIAAVANQHGMIVTVLAVRGCVTDGSPINDAVTSFNNGGLLPGLTTSEDDCLVALFFGYSTCYSTQAHVSAWTNGDLASITERFDSSVNVGYGPGQAVATGEKAAAGTIGSTSVTHDLVDPSTYWGTAAVALQGAAGAPAGFDLALMADQSERA